MRNIYRYTFDRNVSLDEIESTLLLSVMAVESLHGRSRVRLDASYRLDKKKRTCVIDAGSDVGRDIVEIFTGYAISEFGENAFQVNRVRKAKHPQSAEVLA